MPLSRLVVACAFAATTIHTTAQHAQLQAFADASEKMDRLHGYVQVRKGQTLLLDRAFGVANASTREKATANTRFQIGSVSKQFTSALVLMLAAEGKLALSDRLDRYFPQFPNAAAISLEQLLAHTAGLHNYTEQPALFDSLKKVQTNAADMMALMASMPPKFQPGTSWAYSNSGYSILGYVLEKVTGQSYDALLQQYIFKPLSMQHSGTQFKQAPLPKATGYYMIDESQQIPAAVLDASVPFAAGAIYSTPQDISTWAAALLHGSFAKQPWLANAWTPRHGGYALGWQIDSIHGRKVMHHGGAIDGFFTELMLLPADSLSIVVMLNAEMYDAAQLATDLLGICLGKHVALPVARQAIQVDTAQLRLYEGSYQLAPDMIIDIKLEGSRLVAAPKGQPFAPLYAESLHHFFLKIIDATIEFEMGSDGRAEKLLFTQGRHKMEGKRL